MFEWWAERRRQKILRQPFPAARVSVLERNVRHYRRLDAAAQKRLRDLVQVFIPEKHWEGCGGLVLDDEMRVTIAAQACLLILELPHRLYENVDSILVYPSAVLRPEPKLGVFVLPPAAPVSGPIALSGEAHQKGPVVLAWDRVLRDAQRPHGGHNLVYHEFAHKLDMLDGHADGTPPLATREQRTRWHDVCERAFLDLRTRSEHGTPTFLDTYGAVDEAEFFAVATEHFFEQPRALRAADPALYEVLSAFYRQDPAALES